jgi:hypothetical protein
MSSNFSSAPRMLTAQGLPHFDEGPVARLSERIEAAFQLHP